MYRSISLVMSLLSYCLPSFLFSLTVGDLSLEEKVGQLLLVHFHGQEANEESKHLIQDLHVGGIIYYNWANGLSSPTQVQHLSQSLQQQAQKNLHAIPLFIAIDQEGGRVTRLKEGFTVFPGNYALGRTGEWQWGEESAWMMGQELKAVGISLNLAPVIDIYTQPANPVIGIRSFSSNPSCVAKWGESTLRGYQRAGIIAVFKHFPGHGDVQVDSHEALPVIKKTREVLDQVELYPFRSLAPQADAMMTAHLLVPELDPEHCVTLSKKVVHNLLRKEFYFQGVIMTDSLAMEGVLSQCSSLEEAVLRSLEAGHDLVILGGKQLLTAQNGLEFTVDDIKRVHRFLLDAVRQGKWSEQRLNESVARILALKQNYGLFDFAPLNQALLHTQLRTEAHCTLARRIARRALHLVKGDTFIPIAFDDSFVIVAPDCMGEELMQTEWDLHKPHNQILYFKGLNPDSSSIQDILSKIGNERKKVLFFAYNAWQFSGQRALFEELKSHSSCLLAIAVRDPLDCDYLKEADVVLCTFSPVADSLQAAFDYANGRN